LESKIKQNDWICAFCPGTKRKAVAGGKVFVYNKNVMAFAQDKPLACDKKYGRNARGCA